MIRVLDIIFSVIGLALLLPLFVILFVVGYVDTGSPIFSQYRVGKHKRPFRLYKWRTMEKHTETIPSHTVSPDAITKWGAFLRKTKLDELLQLVNVLKGDMSLVGPRPNLPEQHALTDLREKYGIYGVRPGITGQSQIKQINMSTPDALVKNDAEMIASFNIRRYITILFKTVIRKVGGDATADELSKGS